MTSHQAPIERRTGLSSGHIYCLIICAAFVVITLIGAIAGNS